VTSLTFGPQTAEEGGAQEEEVARLEHELAVCRAERAEEAARLEAELAEHRSEREELAAAAAATQARLMDEVRRGAARRARAVVLIVEALLVVQRMYQAAKMGRGRECGERGKMCAALLPRYCPARCLSEHSASTQTVNGRNYGGRLTEGLDSSAHAQSQTGDRWSGQLPER
jgi:hypothetical protein